MLIPSPVAVDDFRNCAFAFVVLDGVNAMVGFVEQGFKDRINHAGKEGMRWLTFDLALAHA